MDDTIELSVEVPAETKAAVERAAAAKGVSVSEFIEGALKKMLRRGWLRHWDQDEQHLNKVHGFSTD